MGRNSQGGVEIREASMRILFSYQGRQRKETLYLDNAPLAPTPANVKYAKRIAAEIKRKIVTGEFSYDEYFPHSPHAVKQEDDFGLFIDRWYSLLDLKSSTLDGYRRVKDSFWKPRFAGRTVGSIKHSDILQALKDGNWKSAKTRNNKLSMIRTVFELAVLDKLIDSNPCDGIGNTTYQKPKPDPFSLEEALAIVADMYKHYHEQVGNFAQCMFFTGLRSSEGFGLDWPQVGMANRTAMIDKGFVVDEMTDDTKTGKARLVRLNSKAFEAVEAQRKWTFMLKPTPDGRHPVFHDPGTNKPWAYEQNFRKRYWMPTLRRLGIRYRRPYNMRHTYATIGLMSQANPAFLAKQLGHSLKMFFDVYADWIDGADSAREMDKIESRLSGNIPELSPKNKKSA